MAIGMEIFQELTAESRRIVYLASLVWLGLLGSFIVNVQPMFLGGLAISFNLNAQQVGFVGGVELAGSCLASLCAPFWLPRANLRKVAAFAVSIAVIGNLGTTWVADYQLLLSLRFLTAFLGGGVIFALAFGLMGQVKNPDRLIAIAIICQVLSLALGMVTIPVLLAQWQLSGMTLALALLFATGFVVLRLLPSRVPVQEAGAHLANLGKAEWMLPAALLLGLVMFSIGLGAIWAFLERMGAGAGFVMADIGSGLAISSLIGGIGALLAAVLGQRLGRLIPLTIGIGGQLLVCWLLSDSITWPIYLAAATLFNFFWNLALPFLLGAIATADRSGRFMVLIPAAEAGGFAMGPMIAGVFIVGDDYAAASLVSMLVFALCLVLLVPLVLRLKTAAWA